LDKFEKPGAYLISLFDGILKINPISGIVLAHELPA